MIRSHVFCLFPGGPSSKNGSRHPLRQAGRTVLSSVPTRAFRPVCAHRGRTWLCGFSFAFGSFSAREGRALADRSTQRYLQPPGLDC